MINIKNKYRRTSILVKRNQTEAEYATKEELESKVDDVREEIQEVDNHLSNGYVTREKYHQDTDNIYDKINELNSKIVQTKIDGSNFKFQGSTFTDFPSENFTFDNVTDFSYMFRDCGNLKSIELKSEQGHIMLSEARSMFEGCESLTNTSSNLFTHGNASSMFKNCRKLEYFDTLGTHLDNTENMFYGCENLKSVNGFWGGGDTTIALSKTCANMFYGCKSLTTIYVKFEQNGDGLNTTGMFYHCYNLTNFPGFKNLKSNLDISDCDKLTLESCINILNDLYDFNGNNITPKENEGKLRIPSNFLDKVGDNINIATNKGWTILDKYD